MPFRRLIPALLLLLLATPGAWAMSSPDPPTPPPGNPGMPGSSSGSGVITPRQEAEQSYALAYEEVGKAKKDLEDGKAKNAEKKFKKALERCEKAVSLDERYHEAWNLLGYTARKTGDYDKSFKAYERCLAVKPDYAPAREYLGEAWLDKGDAKKAREQLVWLERLGASEELKTLKTRYDAYVAQHPEAAAPASTPAPADSSGAGTGTGSGSGSGH
jgi:tetratricopeptide (TPR) repeat protein